MYCKIKVTACIEHKIYVTKIFVLSWKQVRKKWVSKNVIDSNELQGILAWFFKFIDEATVKIILLQSPYNEDTTPLLPNTSLWGNCNWRGGIW